MPGHHFSDDPSGRGFDTDLPIERRPRGPGAGGSTGSGPIPGTGPAGGGAGPPAPAPLPATAGGTLPPPGQTEKIELLSAAIGRPVTLAYGRHIVAGNVIFMHENSDGSTTIFIALGEGEWDSIEVLYVNGARFDHTDTARVHFHPAMDGETGTESDPATRNQKICSLWPSIFGDKFTFSRTAYLALKLDPDPSAPEPGYDIRGIYRTRRVRIFNSSGSQTGYAYSVNPAWITLDLLIHSYLKPRALANEALTTAEKARIDFPAFADWAADCDVTTPQGTKRFEANVAFVDTTDLHRGLEWLLLLGRAYLLERNGKLAPFMDKARSSIFTFGYDHLARRSFTLGRKNQRDLPNRFLARFRALDSGAGPGTISSSGTAVTGTGTEFLKWFSPEAVILLNDGAQAGESRVVSSVASDTALTLKAAFSTNQSGRKYSNPALEFQPQLKETADETHQDQAGRIVTAELDLGNSTGERAERLLDYLRRRALDLSRQGGAELLLAGRGERDLLPGDVIHAPASFASLEQGAGLEGDWEILQLTQRPDGGIGIGLQEFDPATFSDTAGTQQPAIPPRPNNRNRVAAPAGLTRSTVTVVRNDGIRMHFLRVAWTLATDTNLTQGGAIEVQYKLNSSGTWISAPDVAGDAVLADVGQVNEGSAYDVRIRARNRFGARSAYVQALNFTVTGTNSQLKSQGRLDGVINQEVSENRAWNNWFEGTAGALTGQPAAPTGYGTWVDASTQGTTPKFSGDGQLELFTTTDSGGLNGVHQDIDWQYCGLTGEEVVLSCQIKKKNATTPNGNFRLRLRGLNSAGSGTGTARVLDIAGSVFSTAYETYVFKTTFPTDPTDLDKWRIQLLNSGSTNESFSIRRFMISRSKDVPRWTSHVPRDPIAQQPTGGGGEGGGGGSGGDPGGDCGFLGGESCL